MHCVVLPSSSLQGTAQLTGDKSISHRALILASLAKGSSVLSGLLYGNDCLATLAILQQLGIAIEHVDSHTLRVHGQGAFAFQSPCKALNCESSGTTMRLLAGLLSAQHMACVLDGSPGLCKRPMDRVVKPLQSMGALIEGSFAPLKIKPAPVLKGRQLYLPMASAQVKSALLFAGLFADSPTVVVEPGPGRDHTERMLACMGAKIVSEGHCILLKPLEQELCPIHMHIPKDPSSAAFMLAAAVLLPDSRIHMPGVLSNPTRMGFFDALLAMGARVRLDNQKIEHLEPIADWTGESSDLRGYDFDGDWVVRMIDEIPILAVVATQAKGTTRICNAEELRVKETDRILVLCKELTKLGACIEPWENGLKIEGPTPLGGTQVHSHGDHRIAMALYVAGLIASGKTTIEDMAVAKDSFPGFIETMQGLMSKTS